jgi:hypothetical protein
MKKEKDTKPRGSSASQIKTTKSDHLYTFAHKPI